MTLNDMIGVPLTILGIQPAGTHLTKASWQSRIRLVEGLMKAFWLAYGFPFAKYPKILVLEMGADQPGEIAALTDLVRPAIAIVTALGDIPAHVEHYPDIESVAFEKSRILKYARPPLGISILTADDQKVSAMRELAPDRDLFLLWIHHKKC
jgi:UDP-N-acetylmuramoyl-tripeptide--D-alanyl-D-alanine ligase